MTEKTVDPGTDNLDDFSDLLFGGAKESQKEPEGVEPTETETPSASDEENESPSEAETEEDSDEEDGLADEPEEDEEEPAPKPRKKSARERINELTARARQAERDRDDLIRRLEAQQPEPELTPKTARAPQAQQTEGNPDPDALNPDGTAMYPLGEFDPAFIRDLTRFTFHQEAEAQQRAMMEAQAAREQRLAEQELLGTWTEKLAEASERIPDLLEKAAGLEDTFANIDPNYGRYLAGTIMSLDYGPDVLNYLADNVAEARRIVAAGPTQAAIMLGRIEARFERGVKSDEAEKKVVSTKAPPVPPRNKGSSVARVVAGDTDDLDAFEKTFFKA